MAEHRRLVEDRKGIAHAAIGLLGDEVQCLLLVGDALLAGHHLQVVHDFGHVHAVEVIDLATRDDGGQNLVLLGGGENENHIRWRLLQGLEKRVESLGGEHVHLVDDKHLVTSQLRGYAGLLHQHLNVLHRVVARGVELENVERALLVESLATLALVTGLTIGGGVLAVDGLGKDAGTGGLAHTARSAEQEGVGQLAAAHRVLQRRGERLLAYNRVERHRTVFAG